MYIRIETKCDVVRSPDDFNDLIRTVATVIGCPVENVKVVFFPGVNMTQLSKGADPGNSPRVQVTCIYDKGETASNNEKLKTMMTPALRFLLPENHQNPHDDDRWLDFSFIKATQPCEQSALFYWGKLLLGLAMLCKGVRVLISSDPFRHFRSFKDQSEQLGVPAKPPFARSLQY